MGVCGAARGRAHSRCASHALLRPGRAPGAPLRADPPPARRIAGMGRLLGVCPPVRWEDKPPAPTYWMHQLGRRAPPELRLDGDQMARVVSELLATAERGSRKAAALRAPLDATCLLRPPIGPSMLPVVASLEKQGHRFGTAEAVP